MLDYTVEACRKTAEDIKNFIFYFQLLTQSVYIAYLIYAICVNGGYLFLNIPLLCVSIGYLIFFILTRDGTKREATVVKSVASRGVKYFKLSVKIFQIGIIFYSVYIASTHITLFSVCFTAINCVLLVLQLLCEVIGRIFIDRLDLFKDALRADFANATAPVRRARDFIDHIRGKEPKEEAPPTKHQKILKKRIEERKERRAREKEEAEMK